VTEPTLSGLHDLERLVNLTCHFGIDTLVAVNKWHLSAGLSAEIPSRARSRGVTMAGRAGYERAVTEAQIGKRAGVGCRQAGAVTDIRQFWRR
jgi:MinD superfamily P-loop ATPase